MKVKKINIAKDYTKFPGPRYEELGPFSGEVFREQILLPALKEYEILEINLDGTAGYGSSFLDEAFAGIVRETNYASEELLKALRFVSEEEPELIDEILTYIKEAH